MLGLAAQWIIAVRVGLWVLPYRLVRRAVPQTPRSPHGSNLQLDQRRQQARQVARIVRAAARWMPGASCLTQALGAQALLHQEGVKTTLRIGVGRTPTDRAFRAHAWLECEGEVILGGEVMNEFAALQSPPTPEAQGR